MIKDIQEGKEKAQSTERLLQVWNKKKQDGLLHYAQLQTQRAEVTKIREQLNYKQCQVIQDFVGHYSTKNKKIYQLVFVIYYRVWGLDLPFCLEYEKSSVGLRN